MNIEADKYPKKLHIATYDIRGTYRESGEEKKSRRSGIVEHTHNLIRGISGINNKVELAVTQSGAKDTSSYYLITPEGYTVQVQGIQSRFQQYLLDKKTGGKDKALTLRYYEDEINNPSNPIYRSLAEQYTRALRTANTPNLLLQNPNPLVSLLKAEELGLIDDITLGQLNVTGVIHDTQEYPKRLKYIKSRYGSTKINLKLIAISNSVYSYLESIDMPKDKLFKVPNGIDIREFDNSLEKVKKQGLFEEVKKRNNLPEGKMFIVNARRVAHKGHFDVIEAVKILKRKALGNFYIAFTGSGMLDLKSLDYETKLKKAINENRLEDKIYLLDNLSKEELIACVSNSAASILPSTDPEGFAYANIEAMLAGTPVITSRLGGPLDYIENRKTGIFVEPKNPNDIAGAIELIINDDALHQKLKTEGRKKAEKYSTESMAAGYWEAINAGKPKYSIHINPGKSFEQIGEGMHTRVYRHTTSSDKYNFVIQTFKPEINELSLEGIGLEFDYLREAYKEMPDLIPHQRLFRPKNSSSLHDAFVIKKEIKSDPASNNLLDLSPHELNGKTLNQLRKFIEITKNLFTYESTTPSLQKMGSCVPDIIDPQFNNLIVDKDANLRLVDTNRLINTKHLKHLLSIGEKLDISDRRIYALLLQRLIFIESKFLGKTSGQIINDNFYNRYLNDTDLQALFDEINQKDGHQALSARAKSS